MKAISCEDVAQALESALPTLAFDLPKDVRSSFEVALGNEESGSRGAQALGLLLKNACVAERDRVAICQDTGTVWVCLEFGPDISVTGDVLSRVDEVVERVYRSNRLRMSVVKDALFDRENTKSNAPAFVELKPSDKSGARLHVMCKGGGSDNASRVVMLPPSAGREGVKREILACVKEKAANACPPLIIGVGVGSTFDKVPGLAKRALMRPIGVPAANESAREFEEELLEAVNATGIGPAALGGRTTALAVHVETSPCHIAALPLAINMGCSATRRGTYEL